MKRIAGSALVLWTWLWTTMAASAQTPVGVLAIDERQGRPVRLGGGLRDGRRRASGGAGGVRLGLLGGSDVRAMRGLRGRSGRQQHAGGLRGVLRLGGGGAGCGAV